MLNNQKELFSLDNNITYLNCAYMSPQLKSVETAGLEALYKKNNPWQYSVEDFFDPCDEARQILARLISVNSDDIAVIPSVSYGIATVAKNLQLSAGESIICLDQQFPSNVYSWLTFAKEKNAQVKFAKRSEGGTWASAVLAEIDDETRAIAIPNCHWSDGRLVDLKAISAAIKGKNIQLILDLTQSLGAMPFSVAEIEADYIICAAYKWLLGPYGLSFMYVNPKRQNGKPLEENWIARKDSRDFAQLVNYKDSYESGARRFDAGQRSQFNLIPMAIASMKQLENWGVENIAAYLEELTDRLAERVEELGYKAIPKPERSAHLSGIEFAENIPESIQAKLKAEKIIISIRGKSIRVSPHLYNSIEDIDRFLENLT